MAIPTALRIVKYLLDQNPNAVASNTHVIDDSTLVIGFDDTGTYNAQVADHINGAL